MFCLAQSTILRSSSKRLLSSSWSLIMENSRELSKYEPQLIAITQLSPTSYKEANFVNAKLLIERAASRGAKMIFLPEASDYIAESAKESFELAEPLNGQTVSKYSELARTLGVWLSLGGFHIKQDGQDKIDNTHIIVNAEGEIVCTYSKSHLFEVEIPESDISLHESKHVNYGQPSFIPLETPCGRVALSICYDMRFPEMSLLQRRMGAHILTFPSAFTVPTGLAHWHTLLRARAIETQCYVVAAALTGKHNKKRSSFGHSIIVDPWGAVIAETSEGQNIALAEIDLNYLLKIRREMPIFTHRRSDVYSLFTSNIEPEPCLAELLPIPPDYVNYEFGPKLIPGSCIFLKTKMSLTSVNKKCFVDGHVLVICDKPTKRFCDLSVAQLSDLSQAVWMTSLITAEKYQGNVQIIVQDGPAAGQTIPHLHFHVLPVANDSEMLVQGYDDENTQEIKWRELDDMTEEASSVRGTCEAKLKHWLSSEDIPRQLKLVSNEKYSLTFGGEELSTDKVIFTSERSIAFTAIEPILNGHHLVISSEEEITPGLIVDHFLMCQKVASHLEEIFGNSSSTIFTSYLNKKIVTNIIPRFPKDLVENDSIYDTLLKYQNKVYKEMQIEKM